MLLDLDGDGPLYRQLTRALKSAVLDGRLSAGARLPATRTLAAELGLSRNTVRLAYDQLTSEGFFSGRSGSGSFVTLAPVAPARVKPARTVGAQSKFAQRVRTIRDFRGAWLHRGLRYNLQYGEPIHDLAALSAWQRELTYAAQRTSPNYPPAQGLLVLRQAVCDYLLRRRGMSCAPENVLIVHGTQQAMALAAQVLVDPGNTVALEDPHYFSARHVFEAYGARVAAIPTDEQGLVVKALGRKSPKLVFVTPSHQFPGGSLMSMARRIELLDYAEQKKCWIFEDDYDSEFRYDAHPLPALSALDSADRVIYAGSFSKVLFPSLRLGYIVVPATLQDDFVSAKRLADMGCASIEQAAMARYISSGGFERHLRRIVQIGRGRRKALIEGLRRVGRGHFAVKDNSAGMHLVAWLPKMSYSQCDQLIALAKNHGMGLHPIAPLYKTPPKMPGLLMGYAAMAVPEIEAAMTVLEKCLDEWEHLQRPARLRVAA
ncbi:MAG: PLP-dependent aminotransferase family protein [Betaproteobacteria bacterium]